MQVLSAVARDLDGPGGLGVINPHRFMGDYARPRCVLMQALVFGVDEVLVCVCVTACGALECGCFC